MLDDLPTWRSMGAYAVDSVEQMLALASAEYPAIPETPSGPACSAIPKISKTLVSYIVGLTVTTPYFRGNSDDRIKGLAETYVKSCMVTLNTINAATYKQFLQDKLCGWYKTAARAPKASRMSDAADEPNEAGDKGKDEGEEGRIEGEPPELECTATPRKPQPNRASAREKCIFYI